MVRLGTNCWKFLVPAVLFLSIWGEYNSLYSDMDIIWNTKELQFNCQQWRSHSLFQSSQTGSGAQQPYYSVAKRGAFPSRTLWPWDMMWTNHLHQVLRLSTVEMHIHCPTVSQYIRNPFNITCLLKWTLIWSSTLLKLHFTHTYWESDDKPFHQSHLDTEALHHMLGL